MADIEIPVCRRWRHEDTTLTIQTIDEGVLVKRKLRFLDNTDDPASVTADSWRLEAELASGDQDYVWFQKGRGP